MATPRISVVIPTHRRETRLRFALEALADQSLRTEEFEVIVVRAPGAMGPRAAAPGDVNVRFLVAPQRGPAAQRNHGWRATRAPLVAFTDTIVQGRTEPDPAELHLLYGFARSLTVSGPSEFLPSCNVVYPRELLELLDGFAEELFPAPWGEDTDLGLRALEAGARLAYADAALVYHAVLSLSFLRALGEARRRRWQPLLVARHPRLRRLMPAGVFVNSTHAVLAAGIAGSFFLRGRGRLIAAAPYVAHCVGFQISTRGATPRSLARLAAHLPVRASRDVVELASTVEGAVRHRSLVI